MTNIIFMDVDGPLIPGRMYVTGRPLIHTTKKYYVYDPVAVGMLNNLCKTYDAKIVFNSSHNQFGEDQLRYTAIENGFIESYLHKYLCTEFPLQTIKRSDGPNRWLTQFGKDVDKWIVVDDDSTASHQMILVSFNNGMTLDIYTALENYLRGSAGSGLIMVK